MFTINNKDDYEEVLNKIQMLSIKKMTNAEFEEFEFLNHLIKDYEEREKENG